VPSEKKVRARTETENNKDSQTTTKSPSSFLPTEGETW
jgi:hypothetical protein